MTDTASLPPAPPPVPLPAPEVEPWQHRLEVMALLLVVSVAIVVFAAFASAHAQLSQDFTTFPGASQPRTDLTELIRVAGSSANLLAAGALLVAFLLVTLGPGDRIGALGTTVLRGLVGVGLITAGLAALSAVLTLIYSDDPGSGSVVSGAFVAEGLVSRVGQVAPLFVAAAIAGYVAWCAFSILGEVPAELGSDAVVDAEEA
jgi:hypothetical protein